MYGLSSKFLRMKAYAGHQTAVSRHTSLSLNQPLSILDVYIQFTKKGYVRIILNG